MPVFTFKNKDYEVDEGGFLVHPEQWDEEFAKGIAPQVGILTELSNAHWCIISFIRNSFAETGRCPHVHEIGRDCGLKLKDLKELFPTGYLRGACKLAGLTFKEEEVHSSWLPSVRLTQVSVPIKQRTYRVDIRGFLLDPDQWDEEYAVFKAQEMKMPGPMTHKHWEIIRFLRERFAQTGKIPTVYETCENHGLDLDDLGKLFPDGYHRGAVKIAGLRQR